MLGRFTPQLCDAVLGREDSGRRACGARAVEPCSWSPWSPWTHAGSGPAYHHLSRERLELELGLEDATMLRRRAAAWCRAHGLVEDAIGYAAAASRELFVA